MIVNILVLFTQDFTEISKLIEESNGKTVDIFGSDLVDPSSKGEKGDLYSSIKDEIRAFAFGRGLTDEKGTCP